MDCRSSLVLACATLLGLSGCSLFRGQSAQGPQLAQNPDVPPPGAVIHKAKDTKRAPKAGTIVAVAVLKEREATLTTTDPAKQMKLRDEARGYYQQALKVDANCRDASAGLARIYSLMGEHNRAFDTLTMAMTKAPKDAGLWFDLGMCHNRTKDFAKASQCFRKSLELDPENRHTMQTLGFTLARAGQGDEALSVLTRAEGGAVAHFHIARMMQHLGQNDACRKHLESALRENPDFDHARVMLTSLDEGAAPAATLSVRFPE